MANSSSSSSSSSSNYNNVSGWQDDNMGCIHNKQGTCSDHAYNMGDGMCICTIRKFGSLWVSYIFVISVCFEICKQRNNAEKSQHCVSCININNLLLDCHLQKVCSLFLLILSQFMSVIIILCHLMLVTCDVDIQLLSNLGPKFFFQNNMLVTPAV